MAPAPLPLSSGAGLCQDCTLMRDCKKLSQEVFRQAGPDPSPEGRGAFNELLQKFIAYAGSAFADMTMLAMSGENAG